MVRNKAKRDESQQAEWRGMDYSREFWEQRYKTGDIPWDLGHPSRPLREYVDQLSGKEMKILIPGCGSSYEAEHLHLKGFRNVYIMDISKVILNFFKQRVPGFPENHLICENFFEHKGRYDLILEQTFFCAIHPTWRDKYAKQCAELLKPGGKLAGVLFDDELNLDQPPFGGSKEEYTCYFKPYFEVKVMERAYNSIEPRSDRELFIILEKKP